MEQEAVKTKRAITFADTLASILELENTQVRRLFFRIFYAGTWPISSHACSPRAWSIV